MLNRTPTLKKNSIAKLLSCAIIILTLFSYSPAVSTHHVTVAKNQTEQVFSKQADNVNSFYPPSVTLTQGTNHIIFNSIIASFNSKVDLQYHRDKVYAHSVDQRINLQLFTPNHFRREFHLLS